MRCCKQAYYGGVKVVVALTLLLCSPALADISACREAYFKDKYGAAIKKDCSALAKAGNPEAQFNLGFMYATGQGVPQDHKEVVRWYKLAAEQGHLSAQFNLGLIYDAGERVPQDYKEAVRWYKLAAEQGHSYAQTILGFKYATGQGVPQDYVQAHMWFNLAAPSRSPEGVKDRDTVAAKMTPAQIAEAQRLAREWKPTKVK